jgi:hypothetical protein
MRFVSFALPTGSILWHVLPTKCHTEPRTWAGSFAGPTEQGREVLYFNEGKRSVARPKGRRKINRAIKLDVYRNTLWGCGLKLFGPVTIFCEGDNKTWACKKERRNYLTSQDGIIFCSKTLLYRITYHKIRIANIDCLIVFLKTWCFVPAVTSDADDHF